MNQIQRLFQLQSVDSDLDAIRQRLRAVLQAQREDGEVRAAAETAEQAIAAQKGAEATQRRLEGDLSRLDQEARTAEQRLYSGTVKNPKELADLQRKIEALGRRRSMLEDEILEAMLVTEEVTNAANMAATRAERLRVAWDETTTRLRAEQAELTQKAERMLGEREGMVTPIEASLLHEYNVVSQRRGGVAVAAVRDGICQGCQVRIPARALSAAQKGQLIHCPSCNRILAIPAG